MAVKLPGESIGGPTATPNPALPVSVMGSTPVPDPTVLTTQASEKAVANLKELMFTQVEALKELLEARFNDRDKAIVLLETRAGELPSMVTEQVQRLQELHDQRFKVNDEKFNSIVLQFAERDTRTELATAASTKAIDAALSAQKEAAVEQNRSNEAKITKSETGFTKQIDQLLDLVRAGSKASDDKIDDLKQRITMIESQKKGSSDSWGSVAGVIGAVAGIAAIIAVIIALVSAKSAVGL